MERNHHIEQSRESHMYYRLNINDEEAYVLSNRDQEKMVRNVKMKELQKWKNFYVYTST